LFGSSLLVIRLFLGSRKVKITRNSDFKFFFIKYRLYLIDRQFRVISYKLSESFIQYQSAISRRDFDSADQIFTDVPEELHNKLAEFLEAKVYT
jgi:hypothetical protein